MKPLNGYLHSIVGLGEEDGIVEKILRLVKNKINIAILATALGVTGCGGGGDTAPATTSSSEVTPPEVTPPKVTPPKVTPPEVTPPEVTPPEVTPPKVTPPEDGNETIEIGTNYKFDINNINDQVLTVKNLLEPEKGEGTDLDDYLKDKKITIEFLNNKEDKLNGITILDNNAIEVKELLDKTTIIVKVGIDSYEILLDNGIHGKNIEAFMGSAKNIDPNDYVKRSNSEIKVSSDKLNFGELAYKVSLEDVNGTSVVLKDEDGNPIDWTEDITSKNQFDKILEIINKFLNKDDRRNLNTREDYSFKIQAKKDNVLFKEIEINLYINFEMISTSYGVVNTSTDGEDKYGDSNTYRTLSDSEECYLKIEENKGEYEVTTYTKKEGENGEDKKNVTLTDGKYEFGAVKDGDAVRIEIKCTMPNGATFIKTIILMNRY